MSRFKYYVFIVSSLAYCLSGAYSGYSQRTIVLNDLNSSEMNFVFGSNLNLSAGDTIAIPFGSYGGIKFYDIHGMPGAPIVITNQGGVVELRETAYSAMELQRSSHVKVIGRGAADEKGLQLASYATGAQGLSITNFSTDIEVAEIMISNSGFAGIMAKTDPSCNNILSQREMKFVMRNISIHDNLITNTNGEGIYIGYTGSSIYSSNRNCDGVPLFCPLE